MTSPDPSETTRLLNRLGEGDPRVEEELMAKVYDELRVLAAALMRNQTPGHTLQPTALIHEAWMRLVRQEDLEFDGRTQFYRLASRVMRSVLVDHARRALRDKRGGGRALLSLEGVKEPAEDEPMKDSAELLALEEGLQRLEALEPELCRLVEMRFFGGLNHPQIAEALGTSLRTVERNWKLARAWLHAELSL